MVSNVYHNDYYLWKSVRKVVLTISVIYQDEI